MNEVVCHGIPSSYPLQVGDVLKASVCTCALSRQYSLSCSWQVDVSCYVNGHHGDTCRTFIVGMPQLPSLATLQQHHRHMQRHDSVAPVQPPDGRSVAIPDGVDPEDVRLAAVTKHALDTAVAACGPGVKVSAIGEVIQV